MFAMDVERLLAGNEGKQALDRGDIRVELPISEPGRKASTTGVSQGTKPLEALQHGGNDLGTSDSQRGRPQSYATGASSSRLSTPRSTRGMRIVRHQKL